MRKFFCDPEPEDEDICIATGSDLNEDCKGGG